MIKKIIYEHMEVVKLLEDQEEYISKICKLILNSINKPVKYETIRFIDNNNFDKLII